MKRIASFAALFLSFCRIGALTFGGGYTMLPLMQREVVEKRHWASHEDVIDYYAVGQCLPGMIAVNTAILIGYKVRGKAGAAVAAAGLVTPSLLIILLIASLIRNFAELPVVQSAFAGIRVAVCALVVNAVYTMAKKGIVNIPTALIAAATFAAGAWFQISPVPLVLLAAVAGLVLSRLTGRTGGQP